MKVLVPGAIAAIAAATVVIGANAVTGERGSAPALEAPDTRTQSAGDQFIHGYDPACVDDYEGDEGPGFIPLECIRRHGSDAAPIGLKPHPECSPDMWAFDPKGCEDAAQTFVPDFGPRLPTVTINGRVIELPENVIIGTSEYGVTTIIIGDSSVTYLRDETLYKSNVEAGDEEMMRPILSALLQE